ncbi:LysE family transporter [Cellulomonas fimi]|uniref:Lysine exporter protein (LysE/YggA) n=1 Tax=Cellulomonas fimi (strain ATCC 484 / DSM 20113 / JCM 1341 / CCUG 24087 / LMG 16345 / NBRC 15513 / NCIMB 8980 / NCTC 7547 / NRS-133) TaxID=590998 RepID=F4H2B2_CELFA|nr:LysE family transporter [Cellulomonas fimi]AEE47532.1 lysine exporter protein (LysE/YggA) [Cellulomonas fimi ATCC 484]NNH07958.1 LysE family transporter [Cellulomonas fimi]VEH36479.1 LysE type translocator [Cellulomonas fimi]
MDLTPVLLGALAGLAVAVPVGAVGVLLLREGVVHGTRVALGAGLGVATVDLLYAAVAVVAGTQVAAVVTAHATTVRWVTTAVLLAVASGVLRSWWRDRRAPGTGRPTGPQPLAADGATAGTRTTVVAWVGRPVALAAYVRFVGLTVVNPATLLIFATVAVGLASRVGGDGSPALAGVLFVAGAGVASAAWQSVLAVGAGALGRVAGERGRSWASLVGALVVLVLAVLVALG